jgi:hypothetical protein
MRTDSGRSAFTVVVGAQGGQSLQVVAQHFGGNILHHRLLRQARDVLEIEAVRSPLESLLDAPALVVQITERTSRETDHIDQVSHQNTHLTIGRNMADQPHGLRLAGTLEVADIAAVGAAQRDHLFQEPAAQEVAHARKARVAGSFHSHVERDDPLIQSSHQPATGVAPVEQQQVAVAESIKMLKQHLALARSLSRVLCSEAASINSHPGRNRPKRIWSASAARLTWLARRPKRTVLASAATKRKPFQRGTKP